MIASELDTVTDQQPGRPEEARFLSSQFLLVALARSASLALFAALCGAVASRALGTPASWLILLLALVLAGALAVVWHVVTQVPWAVPAATWRHWAQGEPLPPLPYAQRDSGAAHVSSTLGQFWAWVKTIVAPRYLAIIFAGCAAALVALALAAALAATSGASATMITILALVITQMAVVWCKGNGEPSTLLTGLVLLAAMFAIGYGAFAPLTLVISGLSIAFAAASVSALPTNRSDRQTHVLQWAGYTLALVVMIAAHQVLGAFVLSVLWLPQALLVKQNSVRSARRQLIWLLAGMLAASLALAF